MIEHGKLGNAKKNARINMEYSQEKLAEIIDITPTHLKHIESEHRKPSIDVLFRLVSTLHISLDNLIFEKNEFENEKKEIDAMLSDCNLHQLKILAKIIKVIKEEV